MDILDKLTDFGKSVAQKGGELAESSKISVNIKKKNRDIKTLEYQIGKYVYEQYKNGETFDEKVSVICKGIDLAYTEISQLEKEKDGLGLDDLEVEVVDADVSDDDFNLSEEEEEILKDL